MDSKSEGDERLDQSTLQRQPHNSAETTVFSWRRWGSTHPGILGRILVDSSPTHLDVLFKSPMWLSQHSWELHSIKANGAWRCHLRSYSYIPWYSETIWVICNGSSKDLQRLFDTGLASPYDRTLVGWTLLRVAAGARNHEVVKFLLSIGLSSLEPNDYGSYPANSKLDVTGKVPPHRRAAHTFWKEMLSDPVFAKKFLVFSKLNYVEDEDDEDMRTMHIMHTKCNCRQGVSNFEIYKALVPYQCPRHASSSFKSRINSVHHALCNQGTAEVIKFMLQPEWDSDPRAVCGTELFTVLVADWLSHIHWGRVHYS